MLTDLSNLPLFAGLDPAEVARFDDMAIEVVAAAGDVLVAEGDAGTGFFVVRDGAYEVRKGGEVVATLRPGDVFGEMSLVRDEPRAASVACVEDGVVRKIPQRSFDGLLSEGDLGAFKVVRNLCRLIANRLAELEGDVFVHKHTFGQARRT